MAEPPATFLPTREPFDGAAVVRFLQARAIPGVEEVVDGTYCRTLVLRHGAVGIAAKPQAGGVRLELAPDDVRDVPAAVAAVRRLFDLDADPAPIAAALGALAAPRPGLRVPGAVDAWELAARAVLGQQVSVAAARRLLAHLAACAGTPGRFPAPEAVAAAGDDCFPMPRARAATVRRAAALAAAGELDAASFAALTGVGPWTAGLFALRLGDPDVFLATDAAVVRALGGRRDGARLAEAWRPYRSYAVLHLWATA